MRPDTRTPPARSLPTWLPRTPRTSTTLGCCAPKDEPAPQTARPWMAGAEGGHAGTRLAGGHIGRAAGKCCPVRRDTDRARGCDGDAGGKWRPLAGRDRCGGTLLPGERAGRRAPPYLGESRGLQARWPAPRPGRAPPALPPRLLAPGQGRRAAGGDSEREGGPAAQL